MEVQIEVSGGLRRQMTVKIPAERVTKAVDDRLKSISRRAKIPGFRPGKAPYKVIEQQYGPSARMDVVSDLVKRTYAEALSQAGANPAGLPEIEVTTEAAGEPLVYVANFEVYPEITLQGLDGLKVERPKVEVSDADIDRLITNLQNARKTFAPVERAVENGDKVTIDFTGRLDGEAFEGGSATGMEVEIGAGRFLPDLETGIVGHSAGETFTVDVAFPEDYRAENLKGKTAQFEITLHGVQGAVLPDPTEESFLKDHGASTVEELREKSRQALNNEARKAIRAKLKTQVLDQLLAANPIDVPTALVQQEIPRLRQDAAGRMNLQSADEAKLEQMLPANLFEQTAQRRVGLGLLVSEVIRQKELKLDPALVDKALEEFAADYEEPEEVKAYYKSRQDLMQGMRAAVLEDQVVEALLEGAQIDEPETSLETLLAQR